MAGDPAARVMRLRYRTTCAACACDLEAGTHAEWDRERKIATCISCSGVGPHLPQAAAGGSARTEAARRRARQSDRLQAERDRRPVLGRIRQGLFPEDDAGRAWDKGAEGEERLAESLNPLVEADTISVLHDRRIPGSRANLDHLIVASTGVWVVDAKHYKGTVRKDVRGGWLSTRTVVTVAGRDRSTLVEGVRKQMSVTSAALVDCLHADVPVHGALCFVDNDWGLRRRPFEVGGVLVTWPRALRERLSAPGPVDPHQRAEVWEVLASELPPAS